MQKVKEKTSTSYTKSDSKGVEHEYEKFDSLKGRIVSISVEKSTFEGVEKEKIRVITEEPDGLEKNWLDVDFSTTFAENLILRLKSASKLQLMSNVTLHPYRIEKPKEDNPRENITFRGIAVHLPDGSKLEVNKEAKEKLPQVIVTEGRNNKKNYNRDQRLDVLFGMVKEIQALIGGSDESNSSTAEFADKKQNDKKKSTAKSTMTCLFKK